MGNSDSKHEKFHYSCIILHTSSTCLEEQEAFLKCICGCDQLHFPACMILGYLVLLNVLSVTNPLSCPGHVQELLHHSCIASAMVTFQAEALIMVLSAEVAERMLLWRTFFGPMCQ